MILSEIIAIWYKNNSRELPWRKDSDPYKIWVSEIILQQTRVNQGMNYYKRFIEEFPTIAELANSSLDRVMKVWQGLGYYSRARNMHQTAKDVVKYYGGVFPDDIKELLKLKGIGDYSAAALVSIAYNKPYAAVDGNVYRILSRYYGIDIPINTSKGKKYFSELASEILDKQNPGNHNQAIMELGALVCLPLSPHCTVCPLSVICVAFNDNSIKKFPVKIMKQRVTSRFFNYIIINKAKKVYIRQRPLGDIWAMLYEFPLIETTVIVDPINITKLLQWNNIFANKKYKITCISQEYKHKLTHRLIHVRFFEVDVEEDYSLPGFLEVDRKELEKYAFSVIIKKYTNYGSMHS
jgi:A/G-specific adenine glycosylase